MAEVFYYWGFSIDQTFISVLLSWIFLCTLAPLIAMNYQKLGFSGAVVSMLALISLVPTTTLIRYTSSYDLEYIFLMYLYWLALLSANLLIKPINLPINKAGSYSFPLVSVIVVCLSVLYVSYAFTGFRFQLSLLDVYEYRAEARDFQVSAIFGYLVSASDNLLPVVLVYCLVKRMKFASLILSFLIFINYGISSTKQVILLLALSYVVALFLKSATSRYYFIYGFFALSLLTLLEWWWVGSWFLTDLFTFRLMFIPSALHYEYFEFFSNNELDLYRQSAMRFFFESPYNENIQFMMGDYFIGDFGARANNGLFSEAYYNLGPAGVLIVPLVLIFIFKIIDGSLRGLDHRIGLIFAIASTFVFMSVPFPTALLSSGTVFIFFVISSLPRKKIRASKSSKSRLRTLDLQSSTI